MHYQLISEEIAVLFTQDDLRFQTHRQVASSSYAHNRRRMFLAENVGSPSFDQLIAIRQHQS